MFGFSQSQTVRSRPTNMFRRKFLTTAGLAGAAAVGSGLIGPGQSTADAALNTTWNGMAVTDIDIANFALNLEYLEAEFYLHAIGTGLTYGEADGIGPNGKYGAGGSLQRTKPVPFKNPLIKTYANVLARDEKQHVLDLRAALGKQAVARPVLDLVGSFTAAAIAAGIISKGETFDPFANDDNFLLGSFIFEDVGVTAYHGAAPYIQDPDILIAASGILAVEAYHAGTIRATLLALGAGTPALIDDANKISALRAAADGSEPNGNETPLTIDGEGQIVAADPDTAIAFSRTFAEVLSIVYLGGNPEKAEDSSPTA